MTHYTRRQFMVDASLAATALLSTTRAAQAAAPQAPAGPRVLVDWHSHYASAAEVRFFAARGQAPRITTGPDGIAKLQNVDTASFAAGSPAVFTASDIPARLRHLDQNGIQRQLLTQTVALGLDATIPLEELRPLLRAYNDELAGVIHRYPGRFFGVAALPTGDPEWAAAELERGHRDLGFIGGSLPLNAFATLEGARTLAPLFAMAQRHRSHFFIHRAPASNRIPGQPVTVIPKDTEYARWALISNTHLAAGGITLGLTDFLDPYPDVTVQVIMLAGFLPYLTDAIVPAAEKAGVQDPLQKLRRLYIDPGPYSRIGDWVTLAASKIGADRILFGTDYGVNGGTNGDVAPALTTLDAALNESQRQLIYIDNSRRLLQSKGITV